MEKSRGITPNNEVFEECGDPRLMSEQQKEEMLKELKTLTELYKTEYEKSIQNKT